MLINISSGFFHSRQKKMRRIFFRIFQLRTWKITASALTSVIFPGSFWNVARIFIALRSQMSSIMEVLPIKYVHNGPFNEPASFGIPGVIFQAKVTKFGTKVGLKMLININSGFFHNQQKKLGANFFHILQLGTRLPSSYDSDLGPFCSRLQLCTRLPSSYDSDLEPLCSRQLRGLPS